MGVEFDRMRRYYALTEWTPEKQELAGQVIHDLRREGVEDRARISALEARCERYRKALIMMVDEKVDYMNINKLGDPETQHTIKIARAALSEEDESDGNNL